MFKIGSVVLGISAWCKSRVEELGRTGIVTEVDNDAWVYVQWSSGKLDKHRRWELVALQQIDE